MSLFKKFAATAMALTMVFGLAACGGTDSAEGETGKTYVIGTDTTFAPFEFTTDAGDFVGIDIDLMNAIAEDQGFNVEFNSLGFNAAVQALEAGQVDGVIAGMSITDERKEKFDFSEPYFDSGMRTRESVRASIPRARAFIRMCCSISRGRWTMCSRSYTKWATPSIPTCPIAPSPPRIRIM